MRDRYDVIVVGARVAGSTLAAWLGDAGVSVLLLDRARSPSTTPSTHFFRGAGMVGVLERLGVLDAVLEEGCPPLTRDSTTRTVGRSQLKAHLRILAKSATASRSGASRSITSCCSGPASRRPST